MMDNVIKSMYVTINSPAGLSTKEGALGVRAKGGGSKRKKKGIIKKGAGENNTAEYRMDLIQLA